MKKHVFILAITFAVASFSFSQELDQRLSKKYSQTELNQMIQDNPSRYNMLIYALDNACYIIDEPVGKEIPTLESIELDLSKPLNFIDLGFEIKDQNQYIRIKGTKQILVVKSEWVLNHELTTKK